MDFRSFVTLLLVSLFFMVWWANTHGLISNILGVAALFFFIGSFLALLSPWITKKPNREPPEFP